MSNYAIFFDYKNKTYRLPVNPEELNISSTQAIQTYEILKLGQIAIPTHMELKKYSFECELPRNNRRYVVTPNEFKSAQYYLKLFEKWRNNKVPVRFLAGRVKGEETDTDFINTLVLIEDLSITEKAGEEGDMYVSFSLLEYRPHEKKIALKATDKGTAVKDNKKTGTDEVNSKSNGFHVVKAGDTLWAIAKKYYGNGAKYNIIYNANKDKIKNPNLIQIGWKLKIPAQNEMSKNSSPLPTMKTNVKVSEYGSKQVVIGTKRLHENYFE